MGLYLEGLIIGRSFASEIWGGVLLLLLLLLLWGWGGGGGGLLSEFYGYSNDIYLPVTYPV